MSNQISPLEKFPGKEDRRIIVFTVQHKSQAYDGMTGNTIKQFNSSGTIM